MAWDDAKKQKAVDLYESKNPTPETSIQIVKEIAEELGETPNGVRMILSKAEVYVKSSPGATTPSASSKKTEAPKAPKVGKADKIQMLSEAISASGMVPDAEILDKLTGKAAEYFATVVKALNAAAQSTTGVLSFLQFFSFYIIMERL